jgi:hypothetical protein
VFDNAALDSTPLNGAEGIPSIRFRRPASYLSGNKSIESPGHKLINHVRAISEANTILTTGREALADPPLKLKELTPASKTPQRFPNANGPKVVDLAVRRIALPILVQRHPPHRDEQLVRDLMRRIGVVPDTRPKKGAQERANNGRAQPLEDHVGQTGDAWRRRRVEVLHRPVQSRNLNQLPIGPRDHRHCGREIEKVTVWRRAAVNQPRGLCKG